MFKKATMDRLAKVLDEIVQEGPWPDASAQQVAEAIHAEMVQRQADDMLETFVSWFELMESET